MIKITFIGAGSTVFAKNVLGDVMLTPSLHDAEIALYDIDENRLEESYVMLTALNNNINGGAATIKKYLGVEQRKEALAGARFAVNAIQVGGYEPCTVTDFEIPKKYGLRQTIGDTLGIGGIFRALRTIPVMEGIAKDMEEVCPDVWFLNYTNPMAMLSGYMQRYTNVKTIGLCHSVQVCAPHLLKALGMGEYEEKHVARIAGINHMAWLLDIRDLDGNDLYPEIRERAFKRNQTEKHG
ncbi:MAG: alpha-glucosidase/alpha-galactosidase, partial [Clostridia bacterium]|nr:alpha-glucosidase/alpha-galactosidase [Clostridia bacterium]